MRERIVLAVDSDKWAARTYAANFPDADIRQATVADVMPDLREGMADLILASPPCQSFSQAGKRLGDADARDGFPDFIEAVRRCKPRQFLAENVEGLMTFQDGRYWQSIVGQLEAIGYAVESKLLCASAFGVAQFRKRVWLWGLRRDLGLVHRWPVATHVWPWPDQPSMFGCDLLPAVTVGQALGIDGAIQRSRGSTQVRRNHPSDEPCPAVGAGCQGSGSRLQVIGGGSHPDLRKGIDSARDITNEPCTTLNKEASHGDNSPAVHAYRWSDAMLAKHPPASPASPVMAKYAKGGAEGLVCITDNPKHPPQRVNGRCVEQVVRDGLLVRRLSVAECQRLMSMPDDFAWPSGITKTARYKIVGNGVCSLVSHHFAHAMRAVDPASETICSLFCGGGVGDVGHFGKYWEYKHA